MREITCAACALVVVVGLLSGCGSETDIAASGTETAATSTPTPTSSAVAAPAAPGAADDEQTDGQIQRERQFFLRLDDEAVALDAAVAQVQDNKPGAEQRLRQTERRIHAIHTEYVLTGEDTGVGANLLLSAAGNALEFVRIGEMERLASIRRDIAEARRPMVKDILG